MKTSIYYFLLFFIFSIGLSAQTRSVVTANQQTYDETTLAGQEITINAERDAVEDSWDDFWSDKYDVDVDRVDRDKSAVTYLAQGVENSKIASRKIDVHSKLFGAGQTTKVSLAIGLGYAIVAGPANEPGIYRRASEILDEFQTYFYRNKYDKLIAEVRDDLEDVRDDRQDAAEDQTKAQKRIRKYREKIQDLEKKIAKEQEDMTEEEVTEADKMLRVNELEQKLATLERERRIYVKE